MSSSITAGKADQRIMHSDELNMVIPPVNWCGFCARPLGDVVPKGYELSFTATGKPKLIKIKEVNE